jgi:hypothetical protein
MRRRCVGKTYGNLSAQGGSRHRALTSLDSRRGGRFEPIADLCYSLSHIWFGPKAEITAKLGLIAKVIAIRS